MAKSIVAPLNRLDLDRPLDPFQRSLNSKINLMVTIYHKEVLSNAGAARMKNFPRMGSAELLENGLVKQEDVPQFVGVIRTEAARLVTLVEDIIPVTSRASTPAPATAPSAVIWLMSN